MGCLSTTNFSPFQLTALPINDGIKMIARFNEKSKRKGRLGKHFDKMKQVAASTLMDLAMDTCMDKEEDRLSMSNFIEKWLGFNIEPKLAANDAQKSIADAVRQLISNAGSARHIYIFTQVLNTKVCHQMCERYLEKFLVTLFFLNICIPTFGQIREKFFR